MIKYRWFIFLVLILSFFLFSYYPTIFEINHKNKLRDERREFILEHNYYWPDFNLYLSKIRQGREGRFTALERYTSEKHNGSLLQAFYVILGRIGNSIGLDPNYSYQMGRILLSPLLLIVVFLLITYYFRNYKWQITAFLITVTSGSFPRFFSTPQGSLKIGRYMEWWSNIDALQRITFIPHILFGQVLSFYLFIQLINSNRLTGKKLVFLIILGNIAGLTFPPSLITLNSVLLLMLFVSLLTVIKTTIYSKQNKTENFVNAVIRKIFYSHPITRAPENPVCQDGNEALLPAAFKCGEKPRCGHAAYAGFRSKSKPVSEEATPVRAWSFTYYLLFVIFTSFSLLYILFITKQTPWSALVEFHKTHAMMIPFVEYLLGTGPIIILGALGIFVSIFRRDRRFHPLIFWILSTFFFAVLFTHIKSQSPLRFTQTGLFIPLGILGTYFLQQIWQYFSSLLSSNITQSNKLNSDNKNQPSQTTVTMAVIGKTILITFTFFYILENLFMMNISLSWQTTWISQKVGATIPPVPYPPQAMYPLKSWMNGIRFLRNQTNRNNVVLAGITAGNYIPAYSGNTVYFGQANTVDYDRKQIEVEKFFKGEMSLSQAEIFLKNGRVKYIFFSIQEKKLSKVKDIKEIYPFLEPVYNNEIVTIYKIINRPALNN